MKNLINLNEVVACAINGIDAGDSKKEAVQSITSYIESRYVDMAEIKDMTKLSAVKAQWLHESFGIEFDVNAGNASVRFGKCM